jgi:hypothetical protein
VERNSGAGARSSLAALEAQLRTPPPAGLRALDDASLADLTAAVRQARHRQAQALAEAGDRALVLVPRLLRGPLRRMLG